MVRNYSDGPPEGTRTERRKRPARRPCLSRLEECLVPAPLARENVITIHLLFSLARQRRSPSGAGVFLTHRRTVTGRTTHHLIHLTLHFISGPLCRTRAAIKGLRRAACDWIALRKREGFVFFLFFFFFLLVSPAPAALLPQPPYSLPFIRAQWWCHGAAQGLPGSKLILIARAHVGTPGATSATAMRTNGRQ